MRIATKLMVGSTAGMLLVLAVHAIVAFRRESNVIEADSIKEGERLAHTMALAMARDWELDGPDAAKAMIRDVDQRYPELAFRWLSDENSMNIGARTRAELALGQAASLRSEGGDRLSSFYAVPSEGGSRGAVSVSQDLRAEHARVRASMIYLGVAVLAILILNALLAAILSRRWVARPLERLFDMARSVGAGELDKRVSFSKSAVGEFVALGGAMNEMASQLETSRARREAEERRRRETEAQLRHAERLTTVGRLASGVAHEIGTPLNVITGNAAMITRDQVDAAGAKKSAATIEAHANRITTIVKQLLGFARRSGPVKATADLSALCRDTLILLRPFAKKRGIEISGPVVGSSHVAAVDANQFEQVVTNLVMNGAQASTKEGTISISVDTVVATPPAVLGAEEGPYVRVDVRDHGTGISEERLAHIFEPFFTTKDVGEGTGLGLSVVHGIVQDHGGWIEVDTKLGVGTTFTAFFPVEEP